MSPTNIYIVYGLVVISIITSVVSICYAILMHKRVRKIFQKSKIGNIEELIGSQSETLKNLVLFKEDTTKYLQVLDGRIKSKINTSATTRFNPFVGEGIGGNQSFTSVFADEEGNGVVLTSMHTRERTNMFAKPLTKWKSEYELGGEEIETIKKVIKK